LNYKLKKATKALNNKISYINFNILDILLILKGKHLQINKLICNIKIIKFFIGESLFKRDSLSNIFSHNLKIYKENINFYTIREKANSEGLLFFNIKKVSNKLKRNINIHILINLNDSFKVYRDYKNYTTNTKSQKDTFWFNTHISTSNIDYRYVIPLISHFEEEQTFLNFASLPQKTTKIYNNTNLFIRSLKAILSLLFHRNAFIFFNTFILNILKNKTLYYNLKHFNFIKLIKFNLKIQVIKTPLKYIQLNTYDLKKFCKYSFNIIKASKIERSLFNNFNYKKNYYDF